MVKKKVEIHYTELSNFSQLTLLDQELIMEAAKAYDRAYAPYSKFKVGSAVRMENGQIIIGSNQENIAYPSGLCAERVTLFSASAHYPKEKMQTLAVYSRLLNESKFPITPCGACRQVMIEYENKQASPLKIILCSDAENVVLFESVSHILPFAFKF